MGWNDVPPGPPQGQNEGAGWADNVPQGAGWGPWEEQVQPDHQQQHQEVQPVQDQDSMILNPSADSSDDEDMAEVQQPLQAPPIVQLEPIHLGLVRVFYGPVLPPAMIWERSFKTLLPEFFIKDIPACLPSSSAMLLQIKFGSADLQAKYQLFSAPHDVPVPGPSSSVVIEELAPEDHSCSTYQVTPSPSQVSQEDFQFSSVTPSPLGKRPRQSARSRRSITLVEPVLDFSTRRMTRSSAKRTGMKPVSAIPPRSAPQRRPKAKKLRLDDEPSMLPLPPPTPIPTLQAIGVALGIDPAELSVEKLMASPNPAEEGDGSHDA